MIRKQKIIDICDQNKTVFMVEAYFTEKMCQNMSKFKQYEAFRILHQQTVIVLNMQPILIKDLLSKNVRHY